MRRYVCLNVCLTLGLFPLLGSSASLEARIQERIQQTAGTVSLYAKNLETGKAFGIRQDIPVRTASTIKLPVMLAVFNALAEGKANPDEELTLQSNERVSGSGVLGTEISTGVRLPLIDVVHLMIVLSDNTATNILLDRFTADAVNAYLDRIHLPNTRAMRKVRGDGGELAAPSGFSAAGKLPENQKYGLGKSTPADMVAILQLLDRGQAVSPAASKEMLSVMKRNQDGTGIRRRMGDCPVANKSGALDALRSDVGIVYSPKGRIAMAITIDRIPKVDWSPDNPGSLLIADLAKMLVDGLTE